MSERTQVQSLHTCDNRMLRYGAACRNTRSQVVRVASWPRTFDEAAPGKGAPPLPRHRLLLQLLDRSTATFKRVQTCAQFLASCNPTTTRSTSTSSINSSTDTASCPHHHAASPTGACRPARTQLLRLLTPPNTHHETRSPPECAHRPPLRPHPHCTPPLALPSALRPADRRPFTHNDIRSPPSSDRAGRFLRTVPARSGDVE